VTYLDSSQKIISDTHFSDFLRASLLNKYGGLYLDSTIFVSNKLPSFDKLSFWTGTSEKNTYTNFCEYCLPNNTLWSFVKDCFSDYWNKNDELINYFIIYDFMRLAYEKIKIVKDLWGKTPINSQKVFDLFEILNSEFDEEKYKTICAGICFHKLTYKEDFVKYTKNKKLTYYGYICQEYEKDMQNAHV
jgi:hypothetical protein